MNEIYWIQRLDYIRGFSVAIMIVCAFVFLLATVFYYAIDDEKDKAIYKRIKKITGAALVATSLSVSFVPSKNEMLMIIGLGGTIDYIKENETLQELPDKCVAALDAWVESLGTKKKD